MELKAGQRLKSAVCTTEVMIVKGKGDIDLRCGGHALIAHGTDGSGASIEAGQDGGSLMGKRYSDDELGLEVLVTKAGQGGLSIGDAPLLQKDAKPLPSSD
jgi:hypothetical protein